MITKRNVYLNMKPLEEARQILFDHFPGTGTMPAETVTPPEAVGRVLAEPVTAAVSSPNFHAAAMDGVAVKAEETFGASETRPKELAVGSHARFLNTGHVMPEGTAAVIMIENLQTVGAESSHRNCDRCGDTADNDPAISRQIRPPKKIASACDDDARIFQ